MLRAPENATVLHKSMGRNKSSDAQLDVGLRISFAIPDGTLGHVQPLGDSNFASVWRLGENKTGDACPP